MKESFQIQEEWLGMEIHPETPPEGADLNKLFRPEMMAQLFLRLNQTGSQYGIKFSKSERLYNSRLALMLSEYSKETGHFEALHHRLFEAYFEESKDIGDEKVLIKLAAEVGMPEGEAEKSWEDPVIMQRLFEISEKARREGITSIPTFIIEEKQRIVGAQPYEVFETALKRLL